MLAQKNPWHHRHRGECPSTPVVPTVVANMRFPTCADASVRLASEPRSDRSGMAPSKRPSAARSTSTFFLLVFHSLSCLHHSLPPFLIFFQFLSSSAFSAFLRTPGNDDQRLAAAAAPVRPQYKILVPFFSFLLTLLSNIFLYVRHNGDVYTHSLPTPLFRSSGLDYSLGTSKCI